MTDLLIALSVPLAFLFFWASEARFPARDYPGIRRWAGLGIAFFILSAAVGGLTPWLWQAVGLTAGPWPTPPVWLGLPAAVLVTTGLNYGWHRAEHRFRALWLAAHQLHHAPQRVDIAGAYFTHPLEVLVKSSLGALVGTLGFGLPPTAASAVASIIGILSLFQHWNVRTPRWLGWLLPRPEMHALHHVEGGRVVNFGDLPLWDLIFGTLVNPERSEGAVGFEAHPEPPVGAMLAMRDVQGRR